MEVPVDPGRGGPEWPSKWIVTDKEEREAGRGPERRGWGDGVLLKIEGEEQRKKRTEGDESSERARGVRERKLERSKGR